MVRAPAKGNMAGLVSCDANMAGGQGQTEERQHSSETIRICRDEGRSQP